MTPKEMNKRSITKEMEIYELQRVQYNSLKFSEQEHRNN